MWSILALPPWALKLYSWTLDSQRKRYRISFCLIIFYKYYVGNQKIGFSVPVSSLPGDGHGGWWDGRAGARLAAQMGKFYMTQELVISRRPARHCTAWTGISRKLQTWKRTSTKFEVLQSQRGPLLGTGTLVSMVSYSRLSLMIIASRTQFHVYLPWGQCLFRIVS